MLDHIGPQKVGVNWTLDGEGHDHPHRGFETITMLFEGQMNHRDSLGNRVTLKSGDIQRMNAGSGIIHGGSLFADSDTGLFHEVQLWVNNPKSEKLSEPDIQNVSRDHIPTMEAGGFKVRVFSGAINGIQSELNTKALTNIAHISTGDSGALTVHKLEPGFRTLVYVLEGELEIGDQLVSAFELAVLSDLGTTIDIVTQSGVQALILSGKPLEEPVAFGGPFVMNTSAEIAQANIDFQMGKFGKMTNQK